ncbi:glutathione S-transferase family protein [Phenylobacterium sp.]|uniref:glutathione S-transferase family protein n=1 Tax=Phenylobacterium sp. TaxID=1871053 RepID=UPI0035B12100
MALVIYGSPRSRTMRTLWAAAELDLAYEHVPLEWNDPGLKTPAFLTLNPAGSIPTIVDDGVAVAESMAINLYLAKKYARPSNALYPKSPDAEAQVWRWSLWAQAHLEPWVQHDAAMGELRASAGDAMSELAAQGLNALDRTLGGRAWLVGERFTIADLNVAGVLSPSRAARLDLTPYAHVRGWLDACYSRPAALAVRARFS